jgi:hypothetical protein
VGVAVELPFWQAQAGCEVEARIGDRIEPRQRLGVAAQCQQELRGAVGPGRHRRVAGRGFGGDGHSGKQDRHGEGGKRAGRVGHGQSCWKCNDGSTAIRECRKMPAQRSGPAGHPVGQARTSRGQAKDNAGLAQWQKSCYSRGLTSSHTCLDARVGYIHSP